MLFVLTCLIVGLAVFTLVALADKRRPDSLSRRGRHLAGIPEEAPPPKRSRPSPSSSSKRRLTRLDRLHFGAR